MMGHREKLKGGDEYDALTPWHRFLAWNSTPRSEIKKRFRRRVRRSKKVELRKEYMGG